MIEPYLAACIQSEVNSNEGKIKENLQHHLHLIDKFLPGVEQTCGLSTGLKFKLLCLTEAFLGGFGPLRYRTYETNRKLSVKIPGEETDALAEKCKQYNLFLSASVFELDDEYPKHFFHTGFIIDDKGKIILKYRKASIPSDKEVSTGPHAVLDRYGNDPKKIFPVAKTKLGNLGMFICWDGNFPEIPRCLALNGAEVFIHPWNAFIGTTANVDFFRMRNRMRAFENTAHLIATNWASSPQAIDYPACIGHSMIVDYRGRIMVELDGNDEWFICAAIDIERLREERCRESFLPMLRIELIQEAYKNKTLAIPNRFLERNSQSQDENIMAFQEAVEKLIEQGIYERPSKPIRQAGK